MHPVTDQNWRGAGAGQGFQGAVIELLELEGVWAGPRCTRVLDILQLTYQRWWRWGLDQDVRGLQLHHSFLPGSYNGALIAVVLAALRRAGWLLRQCKQRLLVGGAQVGDQVSVLLLLVRYRRLCLTTTLISMSTGLSVSNISNLQVSNISKKCIANNIYKFICDIYLNNSVYTSVVEIYVIVCCAI